MIINIYVHKYLHILIRLITHFLIKKTTLNQISVIAAEKETATHKENTALVRSQSLGHTEVQDKLRKAGLLLVQEVE